MVAQALCRASANAESCHVADASPFRPVDVMPRHQDLRPGDKVILGVDCHDPDTSSGRLEERAFRSGDRCGGHRNTREVRWRWMDSVGPANHPSMARKSGASCRADLDRPGPPARRKRHAGPGESPGARMRTRSSIACRTATPGIGPRGPTLGVIAAPWPSLNAAMQSRGDGREAIQRSVQQPGSSQWHQDRWRSNRPRRARRAVVGGGIRPVRFPNDPKLSRRLTIHAHQP